jgi:hypothetical protein
MLSGKFSEKASKCVVWGVKDSWNILPEDDCWFGVLNISN